MKFEAAAMIPGLAKRYQKGTEPSAKSTHAVAAPLFGRAHASAARASCAVPAKNASAATPATKSFLTAWMVARCSGPSRGPNNPSLHSAGVARHLRTILVLLLLAGTAAAFVVTEELKLEPDPIARPRITPTFSPTCRCETQTAQIAFRLRQSDRLTLTVLDEDGQVIRTLLRDASFGRGNHAFGWDGRRSRPRCGGVGRSSGRRRNGAGVRTASRSQRSTQPATAAGRPGGSTSESVMSTSRQR